MKKIKKNKKEGFVILFAVSIAMIILLISSSMYRISKKQTILSSYARESQRAFYAASSALECAFFYDISDFISETSFPITATDGYETKINCNGRDDVLVRLLNTDYTDKNEKYTHSFVFRYPNPNVPNVDYRDVGCAYVLVEKKIGDDGEIPDTKKLETRITAVGFNTCKLNTVTGYYDIPDFDDPTLLERRISSGYVTTYYVSQS